MFTLYFWRERLGRVSPVLYAKIVMKEGRIDVNSDNKENLYRARSSLMVMPMSLLRVG